ncbi:MAG TPA: VWA domain-containing protein [Blastocatellia bacterium]|nr:VWA domain-containing protein [Blastocatellia bacterium]
MRILRYTLIVCFALNLSALILPARSFTQSTGENAQPLIKLNVLVTDVSKRPVTDLNQEDFLVFDDGKQQPVAFFQKKDVPISYALLIDNTGSVWPRADDTVQAAKSIVSSNRPEDQTFILRLIDKQGLVAADWTSDKTTLLDSLSIMKNSRGRMPLIDSIYACSEEIAKHLAGEEITNRRRAIVLITDGLEHGSSKKMDELVSHLLKNHIQVFAVGIMMLQTVTEDERQKDIRRKGTEFMKSLTEATGGRTFYPDPGKDLKTSAELIAGYLRSQYVIGYSLPPGAKKDSAGKVRVKLVNAPGREKYSVTSPTRYAQPGK